MKKTREKLKENDSGLIVRRIIHYPFASTEITKEAARDYETEENREKKMTSDIESLIVERENTDQALTRREERAVVSVYVRIIAKKSRSHVNSCGSCLYVVDFVCERVSSHNHNKETAAHNIREDSISS